MQLSNALAAAVVCTAGALPLSMQSPVNVNPSDATTDDFLLRRSPVGESIGQNPDGTFYVDVGSMDYKRSTSTDWGKWNQRIVDYDSPNEIGAKGQVAFYKNKHKPSKDPEENVDREKHIKAWEALVAKKIADTTPRRG